VINHELGWLVAVILPTTTPGAQFPPDESMWNDPGATTGAARTGGGSIIEYCYFEKTGGDGIDPTLIECRQPCPIACTDLTDAVWCPLVSECDDLRGGRCVDIQENVAPFGIWMFPDTSALAVI